MTKPEFTPFADGAASLVLGGLTVENGVERVALYGSLDLARDAAGLALARRLKAVVDAAVLALEGDPDLPERAPAPREPKRVKNPFG